MTIREYIQTQVFDRRAREHGSLVIYDPARRYRNVALGMTSDRCRVIDASQSVIEQREVATDALLALAAGEIHQLVIWIPANPPQDEDGKQRDPFSTFGEIGAVFPHGDGDNYDSICRRAKPDHIPEINRLFAEDMPTFEMVDALDQGGSWPKLKTLLNANSPKEILIGILSPKPEQAMALKNDATWVDEAAEFIQRILGHKLKTRGKTRESIAEELWTLTLFSEFAFDNAGNVPEALAAVPRAGDEAKSLVFELCEDLRKHQDHKELYRQTAKKIEEAMVLSERCAEYKNCGDRDTFEFEERVCLQRIVETALTGQTEEARELWQSRQKSIWLGEPERQAEWLLAVRALDLVETAARLSAPKFQTLESIINGYAVTWRDLDRYHREMEHAVQQVEDGHDGLDSLVARARADFFRSVEALQAEFIRLVAAEGWPVVGGQLISNSQVFAKIVAPALEAGKRVAYFLVDSLRYELGVELEKQLSEKHKVVLQTVCAQLPTYTEVGMASLMPEADSALKLVQKDGKLITTLAGEVTAGPAQRFTYLRARKGDQCQEVELDDLLRQRRIRLPERIKLLLVRTNDIDSMAHATPHQVHYMIPVLVRQIIRGLAKLADLGFDQAVIATDHGFILLHEQPAGNVAPRPSGNWILQKTRCELGTGSPDGANLVMKANELGIPVEAEHFGAPRTLAPYSRNELYYHEGLSLQECVLPCLMVQLESTGKRAAKTSTPRLTLTYRQGKSHRITTRRPVVDLTWPQGDFFDEEGEIEVVMEAIDSKGNVVGTVSTSPFLNPATGGVRIKCGSAQSIALKMNDDFAGRFIVRVLDQANAVVAELKLETGYLE